MPNNSQAFSLNNPSLDVTMQWVHQLSEIAMVVLDPKTQKIAQANHAFARLVGSDMNSILEKTLSDLLPHGELSPLFSKSVEPLQTALFETNLKTHNGKSFPCQVQWAKIPSLGSHYLALNILDLTKSKKLKRDLELKQEGLIQTLEELKKKNDDLLALDKAKDKFLGLVAHELRTPLNTVVSTGELLQAGYVDGAEKDQLLKNLVEQSHFLLNLVNDILDLTKIQSGKMDFYIHLHSIAEVTDTQAQIYNEMALKEQVRIVIEHDSDPVDAYFDSIRMGQILGNLISNAIKFNKPDGEVKIKTVHDEKFVYISVIDTGAGIPNDKLEAIFDEFETVGKINNHHKGTGLGLSIVRALVRGQGGEIKVTSTVGVGSEFKISVPREKILDPLVYRTRQEDEVILF